MTLVGKLTQLGFDTKEASVYLAGLQIGQETAYNIAKHAKQKRSTVYFVLEKLKEKGLVSVRQTRKVTYYSMISPNRLSKELEKRKVLFEQMLPELQETYERQPSKPVIQTFEGREGIMQIYGEANEYLKKSKEVLYFGSVEHYGQNGYKEAIALWTSMLKSKNYKAREIISRSTSRDSSTLKEFLSTVEKNENPNHIIRFLPKELHFVDNDNLIYGDKLAIFSYGVNVFAVVIESKNIADSYRSLFEAAWKNTESNMKR